MTRRDCLPFLSTPYPPYVFTMKVSRLLHLLLLATLLALPTLSMLADTPKTAAPTGTFKAFPVSEARKPETQARRAEKAIQMLLTR